MLRAIVVPARQCGRTARVARQQIKKRFENRRIKLHVWRQLPENRAEFFAKRQQAGGEEVCERCSDISQSFQVCDETRAFDCENEIGWRLCVPPLITRRELQRIK